jgi:ABC-type cobalamin/Fe3+-siderophores transport system ATPase subunit
MRFVVLSSPKPPTKNFPVVILAPDSWDDYGLKTMFRVTYWVAAAESTELGSVKILNRGQKHGRTQIPDRFTELREDYCSLGQNLEYYETIRKLPKKEYEALLTGLRDVVFSRLIRAGFEDEQGFKDSLLRSTAATSALEIAPSFFSVQAAPPSERGPMLHFKTSVGGTSFLTSFDFDGDKRLPGRVNTIIGYNGTGKTQLLANLAMVACTSATSKSADKVHGRYGELIDSPHSFGAVIAVSYSAFDTFDVPGENVAQRKRVAQEGELLGYVYCGLRDLESAQTSKRPRLKSFSDLSDDFARALDAIAERKRQALFVEALAPIALEASLQRLGILSQVDKTTKEWQDLFGSLSSGHKIVLSVVAHLAAYLQKRSLVLIDEPEAHLHPPLLAALLKSLRRALEAQDSYAVVATHSPVALQETPARFVRILRRFGESTSAVKPTSETFGENIGILTRDVFDLNSSETDFHDVLERLATDLTVEEIETLFGHRLGFQARSYVTSTRQHLTESSS